MEKGLLEKTGKSLEYWIKVVKRSKMEKHLEIKIILIAATLAIATSCSDTNDKKVKYAVSSEMGIKDNVHYIKETDIKNRHMTSTEKEVLEVVKAWNDCFTNNDIENYFNYIHDDLTLFIPSSPYRIDGKKDDKEEFEWSISKSKTKVHFFQELQPTVQVYDSTAIVSYYNRGAYGPDGNEQIYYLKETNVLIRENEKWKIIHIHTSK